MEVGSRRDSIRQEVNFSYFRRFAGTSLPPPPSCDFSSFTMRDNNKKNNASNNNNKRPCTLIYFPAARKMARDRCRGLIRSRNVFTWFHRIAVWLTRDIQFPCRRRMRRHEAPTVRSKTFDTRPSSAFLLRNNNRSDKTSIEFFVFQHRCNPRWSDSRAASARYWRLFFLLRGMKKSRTYFLERVVEKRKKKKKEKKNWLCVCNGEINIGKCLLLNSRNYYACY